MIRLLKICAGLAGWIILGLIILIQLALLIAMALGSPFAPPIIALVGLAAVIWNFSVVAIETNPVIWESLNAA